MKMEPPVVPDGEVTLAGAGHHAVSVGDVERARRASVLAYCARICDPARIAEAADAAFAELLAALEATPADRVAELDRMLLEATRDAAAERVDAAAAAGARLTSRRSAKTCSVMPTLLAARASGRLGASDRAAMERHLTRCTACRDLEQRRDEAEQAYAALIGASVEPESAQEPFAPGDPEPEVFASRSQAESEREGVVALSPLPQRAVERSEAVGASEPEIAEEATEIEGGLLPEPEAVPAGAEPEGIASAAEPGAGAEAPDDAEAEAEIPDDAEAEIPADAEEEAPADAEVEAPADAEEEAPDDAEEEAPAAMSGATLLDPPEFDAKPFAAKEPVNTEEFEPFADTGDEPLVTDPDDPRATMPTWRDGAPIGGTRTRRGPGRKLIAAMFVAGVVILAIGLFQLGGDDGGTTTKSADRQNASTPTPATQQPAQPEPDRAELRRRARLRSLGDRELGPGTSGDDVKALQKLLGVSETGNFGELTAFAVTDFQSNHGLPTTGIADEATKRKLARRSRPPQQAPTPPVTQTEPDQGTANGEQPQATQPEGTTPQQTQPQATPQQPAQPGQ